MTGPGANVATIDHELVERRLSDLLDELGDARPDACCAGAAGAEVAASRAWLLDLLARRFPATRACVVHDAHLILAAAGVEAGIALIAGTGSVAYARSVDGREARRGGWGWMVADEGSGVWIAREAARLVMAREDGGSDIGPLGYALLAACAADDPRQMIAALHSRLEPMRWAELATIVFETAEADSGAREIVGRAARELARLAASLGALCPEGPVVLAGGLLLKQPLLERDVRALIPMECIRLEEAPVEGALRLAEGLLR